MILRLLIICSLFKEKFLVRYDAVTQQTGYFWHIDSANLNLDYNRQGDRQTNCQKVDRDRLRGSHPHHQPLGEFGESSCDSPVELVRSATQFIKKVRGDDFDFILWTGDSRAEAVMRDDNSTRYLEEMTILMREEFPYSSIYPVLGDQDFNPPSQAKPKEGPMYLTAGLLWQTWLPPKAIETLKSGGFYKIDLAGRQLQLVAINTALYLESNMETRHNYHHDPANQWHWLQKTLKAAREKHKTVIIFGHSPPGVFEHDWSTPGTHWLQHSHNIRYHRLIEEYSDVIVGQFFGHQNTDTFRVFYNKKRQPISWALVSPGISPISRLDGVREPVLSSPSIRLYKYSIYDGKVLDYSQFSLSLAQSKLEGRPVWDLHYNFSSYYNTEAITPHTMDLLYRNMVEGEGQLTHNYLMANTGGLEHPNNCPQPCRKVHLCSIPNVDITNFMKCVTAASSAESLLSLSLANLLMMIKLAADVRLFV